MSGLLYNDSNLRGPVFEDFLGYQAGNGAAKCKKKTTANHEKTGMPVVTQLGLGRGKLY